MLSIVPYGVAEPSLSYEEFMKTYQPLLDKAFDEKLAPYKQTDIGVMMHDVACFNGGIQVLRFSSPLHVACLKPEAAKILVQREWGATKYDETKYSDGHGYECSLDWVIYYDMLKPNNSELIYHFRQSLKEISEPLMWHPVIIDQSTSKSLVIHSGGNFSQKEVEMITDSLKIVHGVNSVGTQFGACI